jgi:autophagy-related protein 2
LSVDYLSKESVLGERPPVLRKYQGPTQVFTYVVCTTLSAKLSKQDDSHHGCRTEFDVNFVMIRVQIRCPSPPSLYQRSGAAILDIHGLTLTSRSPLGVSDMYPPGIGTQTESTHQDSSSRDNHLLTAEWRTLLFACSSAGAETARGFCSVGPLLPDPDAGVPASHDHIRFQYASPTRQSSFVKLSQNPPSPSGQNGRRSAAVVAEIDIPSIVLNISKPLFDGLQFWADDVSQLLERTIATDDVVQENMSRDPSLLGSRFFSNSKHNSVEIPLGEISSDNIKSSTESIVKVTISEGESLHKLISLVLIRHSFHEALNSSERGRISLH